MSFLSVDLLLFPLLNFVRFPINLTIAIVRKFYVLRIGLKLPESGFRTIWSFFTKHWHSSTNVSFKLQNTDRILKPFSYVILLVT